MAFFMTFLATHGFLRVIPNIYYLIKAVLFASFRSMASRTYNFVTAQKPGNGSLLHMDYGTQYHVDKRTKKYSFGKKWSLLHSKVLDQRLFLFYVRAKEYS